MTYIVICLAMSILAGATLVCANATEREKETGQPEKATPLAMLVVAMPFIVMLLIMMLVVRLNKVLALVLLVLYSVCFVRLAAHDVASKTDAWCWAYFLAIAAPVSIILNIGGNQYVATAIGVVIMAVTLIVTKASGKRRGSRK